MLELRRPWNQRGECESTGTPWKHKRVRGKSADHCTAWFCGCTSRNTGLGSKAREVPCGHPLCELSPERLSVRVLVEQGRKVWVGL